MYLHSSSLIDGATGFMQQKNAFEVIRNNIQHVIEYARAKTNIKFCTISEAAVLIKNR